VCNPEPCPTTTEPAKLCLPPYWDLGGRSGGSTEDGAATFSPAPQAGNNSGATSSSSSESDGGCQVAPALGSTSGAAGLVGLLGILLGFAVRRRRAAID